MCYVEVHDWPAVRGRLLEANARYTPRGVGSGDRSRRRLGASQGAARRCCSASRAPVLPGTGRVARTSCRRHEASSVRPRAARRALAVQAQPAAGRRSSGATCASGWRCRRPPPRPRPAEKEKGHACERIAWASKRDGEMFDFDYVDYQPGWFSEPRQQGDGARPRPRRGREGVSARQVQVRARRARHPAGLGRLCARHRGRPGRRRRDAHLHRQGPALTACWSPPSTNEASKAAANASSIRCDLAETRDSRARTLVRSCSSDRARRGIDQSAQ